MACTTAQYMLSVSSCSCAFLRRPQRLGVGGGSGRVSMVSCNASSSPPPPPPASSPDESDCNTEECAPEKEVGNLSVEWLAGERTKVVGTFPPKKGWTGYVEKDTAGQTNIYSVEPTVYVAESAISSGTAGTSTEGSENTVAVTTGIALFSIAAASAVLLQVGKNQPPVQGPDYSGPPLSYYITKFKPAQQTVEASVATPALQSSPSVEAFAPTETSSTSSTVEMSALPNEQQLSSSAQVEAGSSGGAAATEVQVGMMQEQAEFAGISTANAS